MHMQLVGVDYWVIFGFKIVNNFINSTKLDFITIKKNINL